VPRFIGCLLIGLTLVITLVGCASAAASPSPTTVATPTPNTSATSVPTAIATPIAYGPVSVFTGSESCNVSQGTVTTDPDGTGHARGGSAQCADTTNDPRLSGAADGTWEADAWGPALTPTALVQWGSPRLVNDGGAWEGRLTGVFSTAGGDMYTVWYAGTGGYAGLAAFELMTGRGPWTIQGQVFPGEPPTVAISTPSQAAIPSPVPAATAGELNASVTGTSDCTVGTGTVTIDATGVEHHRGAPVNCTDTANDPRVSGTFTAAWNVDWWPTSPGASTGANVQWGTARLENAGGAWEGRGTGTYSTDRGDVLVFWWKGTGGYAGLTYFEVAEGFKTPWATRGQIFPGEPPAP
jgi:hypothetical protein